MKLTTVRFKDIGLKDIEIPTFDDLKLNKNIKDGFEYEVVFYDIFFRNGSIFFIGPHLENRIFKDVLKMIYINSTHIDNYQYEYSNTDNYVSIKISNIGTNTNIISFDEYSVEIEDRSSFNAGNRVFYTMQKNNNIQHIKEWILINLKIHNPDFFIIYDNGSNIYTLDFLRAELKNVFSNVIVESLPFKWGIYHNDVHYGYYLQYVGLKHCMLSYFNNIGYFINTDIDEIFPHFNLFDSISTSNLGVMSFNGEWLSCENLEKINKEIISFSDHSFRMNKNTSPKYVVDLSKINFQTKIYVHSIDSQNRKLINENYYHFRMISNNWKYNRSFEYQYDQKKHIRLSSSEIDLLSVTFDN